MPDPSSMFDRLAQGRQKSKAVSQSEDVPTPQKRQRKATGKRSDPDYTQVGAYIPKTLNKEVKRLLVDADQDFSELMTELLENWVKQQGA
ncbi:MAG TPA: hypothetical protein V6D29_14470 [Leptolyngbyaceae cyanobacterium]